MCIALVVDGIGSVFVRRPLQNARLPLLTLKGQWTLVCSEWAGEMGRLLRVLLPLTQPSRAGWNGATQTVAFDSRKNFYLRNAKKRTAIIDNCRVYACFILCIPCYLDAFKSLVEWYAADFSSMYLPADGATLAAIILPYDKLRGDVKSNQHCNITTSYIVIEGAILWYLYRKARGINRYL